jgi:hypothetical protein
MKVFVLYTVMPCSLVNKGQGFGDGGCMLLHSYPFATWLSLQPDKEDSIFLRNAGTHTHNIKLHTSEDRKLKTWFITCKRSR